MFDGLLYPVGVCGAVGSKTGGCGKGRFHFGCLKQPDVKPDPKEILQQFWGYPSFRGSQEKIIRAVLNDQDVLALLPTGGGKSLCFQIPALCREGICIVVSPLIALIQNQVDELKNRGIKAIALTGGKTVEEVGTLLDNCIFGNYKFLYLSPERLQQDLVQARIRQMNVNLIAIDEAHCISQWGHDFRPAYLACSQLRALVPEAPVIALTATATTQVAKDIGDNLKFTEPLKVTDSFSRSNIALKVYQEEDKRHRLKTLCQASTSSAIVYVRTRRLAQEIAAYLEHQGCRATYFHGGIPQQEKEKRLRLWLSDTVPIMVATNAFGMGIDKPDVELVIHYQIPDCLENYFQEAGRAGRDGRPAQAILLTNSGDLQKAKRQFLRSLPDTDYLKRVYHKLNSYFQIPYGEGSQQTVQLDFNTFCSVYDLKPMLTYATLRILDQYSVIALSEAFSKKTSVRFIATKEQLFAYFENNRSIVPVAQTLLRTYGGIFDFDTKINIPLIAKKAACAEPTVTRTLEQLQQDEIIDYKAQSSDIELTFLVPREDERTIHVFAKKVQERQTLKMDNLEQMFRYATNERVCRSQHLLNYFGETLKTPCGICDICQRNQGHHLPDSSLREGILAVLEKRHQTSRELIASLRRNEAAVLASLQELLEEGRIKVNVLNQYELT